MVLRWVFAVSAKSSSVDLQLHTRRPRTETVLTDSRFWKYEEAFLSHERLQSDEEAANHALKRSLQAQGTFA